MKLPLVACWIMGLPATSVTADAGNRIDRIPLEQPDTVSGYVLPVGVPTAKTQPVAPFGLPTLLKLAASGAVMGSLKLRSKIGAVAPVTLSVSEIPVSEVA